MNFLNNSLYKYGSDDDNLPDFTLFPYAHDDSMNHQIDEFVSKNDLN